jgi:hypothetical protein
MSRISSSKETQYEANPYKEPSERNLSRCRAGWTGGANLKFAQHGGESDCELRVQSGGREDLAEAIAFAADGKVRPEIHKAKLEDINRVFARRAASALSTIAEHEIIRILLISA